MTNKITQKEYYNAIIARLNGDATDISDTDIISFVNGRIDLLNKKSASRKPTKTQEENENLKAVILNALNKEGKTVSEIIASAPELAGMNTQKITPLLYQLKAENKADKTTDGKKTLFVLV